MRKIAIALYLAALLCGCEAGIENAGYRDIDNLSFVCINRHIYILNPNAHGYVFTPLFATDSDTPMLVRCPGRDLSQAGQ